MKTKKLRSSSRPPLIESRSVPSLLRLRFMPAGAATQPQIEIPVVEKMSALPHLLQVLDRKQLSGRNTL
jgi:hypothetical protein